MAGSMLKTLASALDITVEEPQAPILLNESPFMGGQGRNAILELDAAIGGAGVVKVQGHPGLASKETPEDDDAGWTDIVSLIAASPLKQEIALPLWIRTNVDTAGTGTATIKLKGVQ